MKPTNFLKLLVIAFIGGAAAVSCNNDDGPGSSSSGPVVAFENPSENFSSPEDQELTVKLVLSETAKEAGEVEIVPSLNELTYGENEDFVTDPAVVDGTLVLPVKQGDQQIAFKLIKKNLTPTENKQSVTFEIVSVRPDSWTTQGNTSVEVTFSDEAALGGSMKPEVGGPNEPNQVYIELSSGKMTVVRRDAWDLGFYAGDEYRVKLNGSLKMFAGSTEKLDIDAVTEADVQDLKAQMHVITPGSAKYVDDPTGDISKTAIKEIAANDDDNPVYLIHLGNKIGTQTPEVGSVAVDEVDSREDDGENGLRGFKKVRILRGDDSYIVQYADLNETSHKEVEIPKAAAGNFNFYSLLDENIVDVEPEQWDMNFTTHTAVLDITGSGFGDGMAAYGFSDFITTNITGKVEAAKLSTDDYKYSDFTYDDLSGVEWVGDDQVIADQWRDVFNHSAADDVFFVLKDQKNNVYKIQFTALVNENGERGYPAFEYTLLK